MLIFTVSFLAREYLSNIYVGNIMGKMDTPRAGDRVLVTNGDGFRRAVEIEFARLNPSPDEYISFGYKRQAESKAALKFLGMKEEDMIFLGYPDGGKHIYAGESLFLDFKKIINDFKPTDIVYPHSNDRHPDHWAVNAFVKYSLTAMNYVPEHEWLYLVHRGDWPTPLERKRSMYLTPPMSLLKTGTNWLSLDMSDPDIEKKSETLKLYKSQVKRISHLMSAFERKTSCSESIPI